MDSGEIEDRLALAIALAREGGRRALAFFRTGGLELRLKGPGDPVTAADLAVDRLLVAGIRTRFADDGILSEESAARAAAIMWVIDPIDGTQNFSRGIARFAVSIGVCERGTPVCGVVYAPVADEMFTARRGGGAFLNGAPIAPRPGAGPRGALVELGYAAKFGWRDYHAAGGRLLAAGMEVRQAGSAALGLTDVACGRLDGYCEAHLESWDFAAAGLIVSEAGGRLNDIFGGDWLRRGGPVVAGAGGLWEALASASGLVPGHAAPQDG